MTSQPEPILKEGETCWRIAKAERAAVLVDAAAYFSALRAAILAAERSIFILGWDIDSRVRLVGEAGTADDGAPDTLRDLLIYAVEQRPDLAVHLLLWDYSVLYALEREVLPRLSLNWTTPRQIDVCLDDELPIGASHHQKVVVIDDRVAFCGGLDLAIRRWDTTAHRPHNPDRVDPAGKPYGPFHDIQMMVDGDVARGLAELARVRWHRAACRHALPIQPTGDPWPEAVRPDFTAVDIAIARTLPEMSDQDEVREVEALYRRCIAAAQRLLYIENQYLSADRIAEALVDRLKEKSDLEVLVVGPKEPAGWLEAKSMGAGRLIFARRLAEADVADRVRLLYPAVREDGEEAPVMVHAKVMVVDDTVLRVGSSNLNNRSMGLDSECDLAIEARDEAQRAAIAGLRDRLLAEHLGVAPEAVTETLEREGSLFRTVEKLTREDRFLAPIEDEAAYDDAVSTTVRDLADAERPVRPEDFVGDMYDAQGATTPRHRWLKLAATVLAVAVLAGLWNLSPLAEWADPERLEPRLEAISDSPWAPLAVTALFVLGGLVVFPVTVMIALTAMTFGPWLGFLYAALGSLLGAAISYRLGALAGRGFLRGLMGRRLNKVSLALGRRGVVSVIALRMVPVAPFTVINMVAGVSHIRFGDFLLGTALGMAPGIALMTALGDGLRKVWRSPTPENLAILAGLALLWIGVTLALQAAVSRWRERRRRKSA